MIDPRAGPVAGTKTALFLSISNSYGHWVFFNGYARSLMNGDEQTPHNVQAVRPAWKLFPLSIGFTRAWGCYDARAGFMVIGLARRRGGLANQLGP